MGATCLLAIAIAATVAIAEPEVTPLWEQQQSDFDSMVAETELEEVDASGPSVPHVAFRKPFPFDPVGDKFAGKIIPGDDRMANPVSTLPFPATKAVANPCYQHVGHKFEWSNSKLGSAVSGTGNWTATGSYGASLRTTNTLKDRHGNFYATYSVDLMKGPGDACFAVTKPLKWNSADTGPHPTVSCVTFYPDTHTGISSGCASTSEKCRTNCDGAATATGGGLTVWHNIDHA